MIFQYVEEVNIVIKEKKIVFQVGSCLSDGATAK